MTSIIFDFDGVLLDSLSALRSAYQRFAHSHGFDATDAEFDTLNGPRLHEIAAILKTRHQLESTAAELAEQYQGLVEHEYASADLFKAVEPTVRALIGSGFTLAIASSAPTELVHRKIGDAGLLDAFTAIIGGDDVTKAKPAPDVYQLASQKIGDQHAVVIEDSEHGVMAAVGAGLRTVHIHDGSTGGDLARVSVGDLESAVRAAVAIGTGTRLLPIAATLESGVSFDLPSRREAQADWLNQNGASLAYDSTITGTTTTEVESAVASQVVHVGPLSYSMWKACQDRSDGPIAVAVSGVLLDDRGSLVLGQRSSKVLGALHWDLVPSGSIDWASPVPDVRANLIRELVEETGLLQADLASVSATVMVFSEATRVLDQVFEVRLRPGVLPTTTEEYGDYRVVRRDGTSVCPSPLMPEARAMLFHLLLSEALLAL